MDPVAQAAWAAWAAAAISLGGAALSARFNKRDMRQFEREQEPKFTATFANEPKPTVTFANVDTMDFTEISVFLDTTRTDRAVMSAFAGGGTTMKLKEFPRRTQETFEIQRRPGSSGTVHFVLICLGARNRTLTTRILCEIEVPPLPYAASGPLMARESGLRTESVQPTISNSRPGSTAAGG
jgi:hypothetical protein